jgi:hypothetical protein
MIFEQIYGQMAKSQHHRKKTQIFTQINLFIYEY